MRLRATAVLAVLSMLPTPGRAEEHLISRQAIDLRLAEERETRGRDLATLQGALSSSQAAAARAHAAHCAGRPGLCTRSRTAGERGDAVDDHAACRAGDTLDRRESRLDFPVPDIPVRRTRFTRKAYERDPGEDRGDTAAAGIASQAVLTRALPDTGTVRAVRDHDSVSAGLVIFGIVGGAVVLAILVGAVRSGISALGTPHDRSAGNEALRYTAALLGGRFQEREEIPWYRRPAQYGTVEGELDGLRYQLYLLPWNTEDAGGSAGAAGRRAGAFPAALSELKHGGGGVGTG
jgi:hypothetical protein